MKVIVGMSGGVDSAVSAKLLKDQGHQVIGAFMRNWDSAANNDILGNPQARAKICPEEQDYADAVKIAKQLDIPLKRIDFVKEYWDMVFEDLIKQYHLGRTPNPDILCNKYIKFGVFFDWAFKNFPDADYIATGHYAALVKGNLQKPKDKWKDQTYFLAQVNAKQFQKTLFPLANLTKEEVRKIAEKNKLVVAHKKDSTGICFIGERDFAKFLQNYIPAQPGKVIDIKTKKIIGDHVGAMYYTIGQRKGLSLGGMPEPYYVAGHDLEKKIIYAAPQSNQSYLQSQAAIINDVNWFLPAKNDLQNISVKFRYKSKAVACNIKWLSNNRLKVFYPDGFAAVTPGQQAVFYNHDVCLGGGIIDQVFDQNGPKKYL